MIVGFTGSRKGMTAPQRVTVDWLLAELQPTLVLHGDCVGADVDFHKLALARKININVHPGIELGDPRRAGCEGYMLCHAVRPFWKRNRDIVNSCVALIAVSRSENEELRSGTWATVRYARKLKRSIYVVYPGGRIGKEN